MNSKLEILKHLVEAFSFLSLVLKEIRKIVDYNIKDEADHYVEWCLENTGEDIESPEDIPTNQIEQDHIYYSLRVVEDFLNDMR